MGRNYYTSGDGSKVWGYLLNNCAREVGIAIDHQSVPRNERISKVLLAAQ